MQSSLNSPAYYLQGRTLHFNTEPKTVYLGVPELWHGHEKPDAVLVARINDTWKTLSPQPQGVYQFGWQTANGDIIYQTLCAVLPEGFSMQANPHGIDITHSGRAYISCASPFVNSIHTLGDGRHIELAANNNGSSVDVLLRWSGMTEKLTISVPLMTKNLLSIQHIQTLNDALIIKEARLKNLLIRHLLKQLTLNFQHTDWQTLLNTPLTNSTIWQAVAQEPRVLVALVIQADVALLQQLEHHHAIFWESIPIRDWLAVFTRYKQQRELAQTPITVKQHITKLSALSAELSVITQLLNQTLFDELNDELLFMQSEDAVLLIIEQLQDEQQQFIQRHADKLCLMDLETEFLTAWQSVPDITKQLLQQTNEHTAVTLLPLLTVHNALTAQPSLHTTQLLALKTFDPLWFNTAYTLALAYLSQQPIYATLLQQDTAAMIEHDENDLITAIEQQLSLANQSVQGLHDDVQNLAGGQEALEALLTENQQLNEEIEKLSNIIKHRDAALQKLLNEIKTLNAKIQDIRTELKA